MFTKEIFLYFAVIFCTSGRIPGISMSYSLHASSDGRGHPIELPDGVTPALDDQDPSLRLIEKIQAGLDVDENCRRLYELHYRKIINLFRRKRFSPEECRDLTQDVFSRVFQGIATFRRESRFERWLFEIAANAFRNEFRRRGAEKRDAVEVSINVSPEDGGGVAAQVVEPVSQEQSALDSMMKRERSARLRSAFQELPPQMRTCCVLRYERGMKYQEIAKVMKISIETVKAHLHQARKRLIEKLGDGGEGAS